MLVRNSWGNSFLWESRGAPELFELFADDNSNNIFSFPIFFIAPAETFLHHSCNSNSAVDAELTNPQEIQMAEMKSLEQLLSDKDGNNITDLEKQWRASRYNDGKVVSYVESGGDEVFDFFAEGNYSNNFFSFPPNNSAILITIYA